MKKKIYILFFAVICAALIQTNNLNAQSWSLTGNAGTNPSINFIGTTDTKAFVIRTKNKERVRILPNGNIGIGITDPIASLDLRNDNQINSFYITNSSTNSNQYGVRVRVNGTNASAFRTGGEFILTASGSNNTAITAQAASATANYGGKFIATYGSSANIAVWGYAGGPTGSTNYAVYGSLGSFSAGNDWAGYFLGRTYSRDQFVVGTSDVPANSSITVRSPSSIVTTIYAVNDYSAGNGLFATYVGTPNNYFAVYAAAPTTGSNQAGYFSGNVTVTGTFSNPSDERLKENIQPLANALDKVMKLNVSTYNFKKEYSSMNLPQSKQYGFLAQNMEGIFPELVQANVDKSKGEKNLFQYKTVNYLGMIPILAKALQEEHDQRVQTETELNDLKADNEALKKRLDVLEAAMLTGSSSQSALKTNTNVSATAKLNQNSPNPFNQNTTISYFIPDGVKNAMIVIYSGTGSKIKAFENLARGTNRISINANTLSPGSYTYILLADGKQVESRQMIITR